MVHACLMPSPSMSENALGEFDASDHTIALCYEALRCVRVCAENIHRASLSIHANPLLSEGAKHVQANDVSYKATQKVLPIVDRASTNLTTEIQRLKNKIAAPAADTTVKGVSLAHEIRPTHSRERDRRYRAWTNRGIPCSSNP
jgi:hypothetical protein